MPDANADIDLCLKHADDRLLAPLAFAIISGAGGAATCPLQLQPLLVDLSSRKRKTALAGRFFTKSSLKSTQNKKVVPRDRLELSTPAFSVPCSTT